MLLSEINFVLGLLWYGFFVTLSLTIHPIRFCQRAVLFNAFKNSSSFLPSETNVK